MQKGSVFFLNFLTIDKRSVAYLVLVSAKSPLTESNVVLSNTPLLRPMFRCRADFAPDSKGCSTIQSDSAPAGRACMDLGARQSCRQKYYIINLFRARDLLLQKKISERLNNAF